MLFDKLFGHAGAGDGLNIAEMRWHHLARPPEHGITTWGGVCSGGKAEVHVDYGQYRSRDPPRVYSAKVAGRDVQSEVEERRAAGGGGEKKGGRRADGRGCSGWFKPTSDKGDAALADAARRHSRSLKAGSRRPVRESSDAQETSEPRACLSEVFALFDAWRSFVSR